MTEMTLRGEKEPTASRENGYCNQLSIKLKGKVNTRKILDGEQTTPENEKKC